MLSHCISAPCDIPDLGRSQHQIFIAHDLGDCRCNFGDDGPLELLQFRLAGSLVQHVLAQFAHGHTLNGPKSFSIECLKDQATDVVCLRIN